MVDKIADSMEQSLFEQQFPQWFVAMTVVALITCMAAPSLPGRIDLVLVSERRKGEGGCMGILELKGWIDQASAFASPQLPLSIVAGRLGLLIELFTSHHKELLGKGSVQINVRTSLVQTVKM